MVANSGRVQFPAACIAIKRPLWLKIGKSQIEDNYSASPSKADVA
jgi:hypothetical protein